VARRSILPDWTGSPARLAEVVLALAALVVVAEALGSFGLLTQLSLLVAALALAGGALFAVRRIPTRPRGDPASAPRPVPRWGAGLGLAVAAAALLHWAGGVHSSLDAGIYRQDSLWYHLPNAADFFQSGDTWAPLRTDPMALTAWFYPMNSELVHAVGMLAFGNDFPSVFMNVVWMALALLAAWCAGRPSGLAPVTTVAAVLVLDSNMMQVQAGNAPSDTAGVFFFLAAAALLLNGSVGGVRRPSTGSLLVAAAAAGLAVGVKVTLLVPVAAIVLGLALAPRIRPSPRAAAASMAALLLGGGYWYLRNLVHAGNPLPWISLGGLLPTPDQLSLYPRPPHSIASVVFDHGVLAAQFAPALDRSLGPLWPLLLLGALTGLLAAIARGPMLLRVLGVAGLAAAVGYSLIPISASGPTGHLTGFETNLRYLVDTLVLGLILLPLALPRRFGAPIAAAMSVVFVLNLVASPTWTGGQIPTGLVFVALLLLLPACLVWMVRSGRRSGALALGAAGIAVAVGLGYHGQRHYLATRYQPGLEPAADNPGFRATPQWRRLQTWALGVRDASIGVVGPPAAFGQYVFYGPDLSNRVRYIGEPTPHGGLRPIGDCASWLRAIDRGGYRYVVVTPASAIGPGPEPQETLWLRTAAGARRIVDADPAAVFRIEGPLDPGTCRSNGLPPVIHVPGGGYAVPRSPGS
jgi:hypothetical protein